MGTSHQDKGIRFALVDEELERFIQPVVRAVLQRAQKEKGMSLEELGALCNYGKSQMGKFLSGKAKLSLEIQKKLIEELNVGAETDTLSMLNEINKSLFREENPDIPEEDIEQAMEMLDDGGEAQLGKEQEKQMEEMKPQFMEMSVGCCYLLDTYFEQYKREELPGYVIRFLQNYEGLETDEKNTVLNSMRHLNIPLDNLNRILYVGSKYQKLRHLDLRAIEQRVEEGLTYKGAMGNCLPAKVARGKKEEHWESFRKKINASSYDTGTYFYKNMCLLARMDTDMWEAGIMFLLLGDSDKKFTYWQKFFSKIRHDS